MTITDRLRKQTGFTMVEIMVSILIFSLSIAGLLSAISSLNRPAVESFEEVQATYIGKQILEQLKHGIDAATWNEEDATLAITTVPITASIPHQGINFDTSYTIEADTFGGRWVTLTINWD